MSFANLLGQTAQIFRPKQQPDGFGDQRHLWSSTPDETVPCRLQAIMTATTHGTRDHDQRDLAGTRWKIWMKPPVTPLSTYDRIAVDGKLFEITSLYPVQHPRRGLDHVLAEMATVNNTVNYGG